MKKLFLLTSSACAMVGAAFAELTLPDMGVTSADVITLGAEEGGSVIGTGLAFAVGIAVIFFGYKLLRRVLKPA